MSYSLTNVIESLLGPLYGNSINAMAHCPLHEDRTPSLSIHQEEGVWKCHQCQAQGGLQHLADLMGEQLGPEVRWDMAIRSVSDVPPIRRNFAALANKLYENGIGSDVGDMAIRSFLSTRGIRSDARHHFWLGWDGHRISFPYFDTDSRRHGNCVAIKYRGRDGFKSYEEGSERAIYNVEQIRGAGTVLIAEGESDTLLAWGLVPTDTKVCGVPGAGVSRGQWEIWSLEFLFANRIYMAFDADEAGDKGAATCKEVLGDKVIRMRPEEGLDLSSHFAKYGRLPDAD